MGPVGSRIVGEVIVGLLYADNEAFVNQNPTWTPALESALPEDLPYTGDDWQLRDIVKAAHMPITSRNITEVVENEWDHG